MPNRAYASIWIRDFDEANMLSHFEHFLATVPLAAEPPGFTELVIRAVDSTETPLEEYDLRAPRFTPAEITGTCARAPFRRRVVTKWRRDGTSGFATWNPQAGRRNRNGSIFFALARTTIVEYSPSRDISWPISGSNTCSPGHAGLLTPETARVAQPEHPDEARFLMWMSQPQNLREYQEKTRENIQKLMGWMRAVEETLPVERVRLWSEGEENFEARLDEILAVR